MLIENNTNLRLDYPISKFFSKKNNYNIEINFKEKVDEIKIIKKEKQIKIYCDTIPQFCRLISNITKESYLNVDFEITEEIKIETIGPMIDISRNAVLKVAVVKEYIEILSLMGCNMLMLYMEDTYELPKYEYFGYLRGAYKKEELLEIIDYAGLFGIEVIPCIQTLAHLTTALKWNFANGMKEDANCLLIREEKTYEFIEEILKYISGIFKTKKIHIGLDEADGIGRGVSYEKYKKPNPFEMLVEHLNRVVELTKKYNFEPMIWSDMIFHLLAKDDKKRYWNENVDFSKENLKIIPKGVDFVYWWYGDTQKEQYDKIIDLHRMLPGETIFAGGIHLWGRITPNYGKTWNTTHPAMKSCVDKKVKMVIATSWGDNGQETNQINIFPGLVLFTQYAYGAKTDEKNIEETFDNIFGKGTYSKFRKLDELDTLGIVDSVNQNQANPSKYLLWQDPILGPFDKDIENYLFKIENRYSELEKELQLNAKANNEVVNQNFIFYSTLANILKDKVGLSIYLSNYYKKNDLEMLKKYKNEKIPELIKNIEKLNEEHYKLWISSNKIFGWEILDARYGVLIKRCKSLEKILKKYLNKEVKTIEEFEFEKKKFCEKQEFDEISQGQYHTFQTGGYYF